MKYENKKISLLNRTFYSVISICICAKNKMQKKNDKKETFNYILKINKMLAEFSLCKKKDIGLFLVYLQNSNFY